MQSNTSKIVYKYKLVSIVHTIFYIAPRSKRNCNFG